MKVSVTLEQAAKNLGTTPELAKQTWMGLAVTENGYSIAGYNGTDARYMLTSDLNKVRELQREGGSKEEIKALMATRVDLETAFNNINK